MQAQLDAEHPELEIALLGVNELGHEAGNAQVTTGRTIPWLQDTADADWWGSWAVTYRDVIILDGQSELVGIYNLTEHSLLDDANYQALYDLLVSLAP